MNQIVLNGYNYKNKTDSLTKMFLVPRVGEPLKYSEKETK